MSLCLVILKKDTVATQVFNITNMFYILIFHTGKHDSPNFIQGRFEHGHKIMSTHQDV